MNPRTLPGTKRQSLTAIDGTAIQRQYLYLPAEAWTALQKKARATGRSVSQVIASFATDGTANLKDQTHEYNRSASHTTGVVTTG